jgi:phosphoribosylanthranilate isomerase
MKKENKISITNKTPSPMDRAGVRLKVCGMKYQDNIEAVSSLQPDYLGFIFHEQSPRYFEGAIPDLPQSIYKVGVFVDESIEFVNRKTKEYNLDCIQLHGHESPEYCKSLCHSEFISESHNEMLKRVQHDNKIEVIKVFSIKDTFDFSVLAPYEEVCDYFLFDTKGKLPGGNGYTFDWNVLMDYPSTKPFFLSGGIGLDQIEDLKRFQKSEASKYCYAIDVNSKFEIEAGLKNIEELKEFKHNVITKKERQK